jgi:hypothetical protein
MTRRRYLVERAGIHWKIRIEDHQQGAYATQCEAVAAAIEAAHQAGPAEAHGTQVLVQRLDPTYRIVWTFGEDSFPPSDEEIAFRLAPPPRGPGGGTHDLRRAVPPPPYRGAAS